MKAINWGILSTGTIASKFASTLTQLTKLGEEHYLLAAASRSREKAAQFAQDYGAPRFYEDYQSLAQDPDLDVIYIATPHSCHFENARLCLENGKNVLCEKSFTVNAAQAAELFRLAKEKNLFIMEAFWTKFLPAYQLLAETLAANKIGQITHFRAQYGFAPAGARYVRKFDPALAGGALLDIGVYTIGVAAMILGYNPQHIHASAIIGEYGTDKFNSITLEYENGVTAHLISTIGSIIEPQAVIYGTNGHIVLPNFSALEEFTIISNGGETVTVQSPFDVNGFEYQIRETRACLLAGKRESQIMTAENTLAVMRLMDKARESWGLKFPCES